MAKHQDYLGKGFATHRNRRLKWDCKLHMIGEKVFDPMIHCCGKCRLPILSYGRMIPCKHVFCFDCAKSTDKVCLRCEESVQRIEQSPLGKIFVCTFGGSKHSTDGCRRTYLSQRDLQAHINHRHLRPPLPSPQPGQPQQQQQQPAQPQQQPSTVQPASKDLPIHSQSRMPNDPRTQGYETFSQQPPPPTHPQGVAPPATHSQVVAPQTHNPAVPPPTHNQGVPPPQSHNVPPSTHNQGVPPPPTHGQGVMHNPYEDGPDGMSDSPNAQDEYGMGRIQVRKSNLITVPLQDNSAPQHPPPHPGPPPQHPPQHMPPPVSGYQSNMPPPQPHPVPPPQHAGYPPHGPPIHSTSYAPPPMGTPHSVPQSVPLQQPQPQNPHYSMAPLPPVPPVSHIGQPPPRFHDSGPHPPPFSGPTGPMSNQSPPFQSPGMPPSTGPGQWNNALRPPPPRVIMTQAPSMPAPVPAPGMSHPPSGPPPPRPDMRPPPPRTDGRYRAPYFT